LPFVSTHHRLHQHLNQPINQGINDYRFEHPVAFVDCGAEFAVHSERVGNAYRVTDKVNIPDLQKKLQRRIDLVTENAQRIIRIAALGPQGL
jgi:hypothetical protein